MIYTVVDIVATILEYLMLYILMKKEGQSFSIRAPIAGVLYLILVRAMTVWDFTPGKKLMVLLLLDTVIGSIFAGHYLAKSFTLGLLHFTAIYLGEIAVQSTLMVFYNPDLRILPANLPLWITAVLLSKLLALAACITLRKIFGNFQFQENTRIYFFILLPLGTILGIMSKLEGHILGYEIFSLDRNLPLFTVGLLVSIICLLYLYQYYFQMKEIQTKRNLSQKQMLGILDFYENRKLQEDNNRKIYHDIQAHMNVLSQMAPTKARREYALEVMDQLSNMQFYSHTGIDILDVIIKESQERCKELGSRILFIGNFEYFGFMRSIDLVAIFHNAIKNALDEYARHNHPEKLIEVQTWLFRNFLNLRVTNYCSPQQEDKKEAYSDMHGYGLKNIKEAVSRYDGETITEIKNGKFYLRIIIPLDEQKKPIKITN